MDVKIENSVDETDSSRCKYFLSKKKRYCRLSSMKDSEYCVEHDHLFSDIENAKKGTKSNRIRCPLDPTHTCDTEKLQKHLKNCNATKIIPKEDWFIQDVNFERSDVLTTINSLKEVSEEECRILIQKLATITKPKIQEYDNSYSHPALLNEIKQVQNCSKALKQLTQNSALLALMENHRLFQSPACFIEFGAGRGQLTTSVIKAIPSDKFKENSFILVDRGTNRRKMDAKLRQNGHTNMKRIRVDIKDLSLQHVEVIREAPSRPLVVVSKHLCGVATDFAMKCLIRTVPDVRNVRGGIIALCCHHRCTWSNYCNKDYFLSNGFSPREFSILTLMSSWAVCHFPKKDSEKMEENGTGDEVDPNFNKFDFLSDEEKEKIGKMCKILIDAGRVQYLLKNGFKSRLIEYTTTETSLENIALVFDR